ncbi:Tc toxin subunit A [Pseudomonas extremorientalis]|uniref:Virulence plasmid A protein n=1 Tax=Pseudomonas extremorientalis TaxID=169669 RepID=A0A1H0V1R1_9PSED|nr:Tc toxin subunit A [Pseudomonas extremorientalis]KAB0521309.1 hypothetical protein F7R08_04470 [Pseudomonas extremorientalis]OIN11244.1 hypothetical protein BFN10_03925 [Pseudomonas extremorientalis]SDP72281.1 virulence plasmid A protein [Pseudomonas extremorientalis]
MKSKDKKTTASKPPATVKANAKPKAAAKARQIEASSKAAVNPVFNARLIQGLVTDASSKEARKGKVSFVEAMTKMGMTSVFDIIREPESVFVERLGKVCDADGTLAYRNALCYAGQIGSLYREHRVSSGKSQPLSQSSGVRSLVNIGPSYTNLFNENWHEFCKVGALAAMDSPVAYLRSIYRLATKTLEPGGQGTSTKILLDTRRPDLKSLLIDHHSTFTPRPMLELVNGVLEAGIKQYLQGTPDADKPIYDVLAERKHPFIFPYNFAHHQCMLGLGGKKPALGELNYRISLKLPLGRWSRNAYGAVQNSRFEAQRLLSGLSAEQQKILTEPSLFTTFYVSESSMTPFWQGPGTAYLSPYKPLDVGYLVLPGQPAVKVVVQPAQVLVNTHTTTNRATLVFSKQSAPSLEADVVLRSSTPESTNTWALNFRHIATADTIGPRINPPSALSENREGYYTTFNLTLATGEYANPTYLSTLSFTLVLGDFNNMTGESNAFFLEYFGVEVSERLVSLTTFLQQTELNATQVEALLSQRTHYPRLSPNCLATNVQMLKGGMAAYYGSCYVNGHGSDRYDTLQPPTAASIVADKYDNAMGLKEVQESRGPAWYLTKTSLNRFDRLQRMIRLQRWTGIAYAELDTLVISAMRSEKNLTLDPNLNTLRALGVFRHLHQHYSIESEEFAALMHDITPFTTGKGIPLFDRIFNFPVLFGRPFILDQGSFTVDNPDEGSKTTLAQLAAGLGLEVSDVSLLCLVRQTKQYVSSTLRRDLTTVSSIYRQARVAQLFGWSVWECSGVLRLLGDVEYVRVLCRGHLLLPPPTPVDLIELVAYDPNTSPKMQINLLLAADSQQSGDLLTLSPGSRLEVLQGNQFNTDQTPRIFSFRRQPNAPDLEKFLKNSDGTDLTLDPVSAGNILELGGKTITRDAWVEISKMDPARLGYFYVKSGNSAGVELAIARISLITGESPPPDILDVLMHLDWFHNYLKDSRQNVSDVLRLLGLEEAEYVPAQDLNDRLAKLTTDIRATLITPQDILNLNLPTHEQLPKGRKRRAPGDTINWPQVLSPLLDNKGLVKALPLELIENVQGQLEVALGVELAKLSLSAQDRASSLEKLSGLLLNGHDRQLRLIEGLAQEWVNLPMDRTQVVVRWAKDSVYQLLSTVLVSSTAPTLIDRLKTVLRHAKAALHLQLSTGSLRLFLTRPECLGTEGGVGLTLESFYLLERYSHWFRGQDHSEEALLGYFLTVNPAKERLRTRAMRNAINEDASAVLANLLNWDPQSIRQLFQLLPDGRATSMAQVDWVRRCQQACFDSGLTADELLNATRLHAESTKETWAVVGQAAVAAGQRGVARI